MLEWKNVCINVPKKNSKNEYVNIVDNLTGYCSKGELMVIAGPSSCGKGVFLECLAGKMQKGAKTAGLIAYNGEDRDLDDWFCKTGYVGQGDCLYGELTVCDTFYYASRLRIRNTNKCNVKNKTYGVLQRLRLGHLMKRKVSSLSVYDRKLVKIAVELFSGPDILFIQNPVLDLDYATSVKLLDLLKELSGQGKSILVTLQPSDLTFMDFFDKIMLMSKGKALYFGETVHCEQYFRQKEIYTNNMCFVNFLKDMILCEKIYDISYPLHNKILNLIDENQSKKLVTPRIVSENIDIKYFSLDLNKTLLLASRHIRLCFLDKRKVLIILLVCWIFVRFNTSMIVRTIESLFDFDQDEWEAIAAEEQNTIKYVSRMNRSSAIIGSKLTLIFLYTYITNMHAFVYDTPVIENEIANNVYTITTYFFGMAIGRIVILLYLPLICIIISAIWSRNFSFLSFFLLMLQLIGTTFMSLSLIMICKRRLFLNIVVFSITLLIYLIVDQNYFFMKVLFMCENVSLIKIVAKSSRLYSFLPFTMLNAFLRMLLGNHLGRVFRQARESAVAEANSKLFNINPEDGSAKNIIDGILLNEICAGFSALTSLIVFVLFSLYFHSSKYMPQRRLIVGK